MHAVRSIRVHKLSNCIHMYDIFPTPCRYILTIGYRDIDLDCNHAWRAANASIPEPQLWSKYCKPCSYIEYMVEWCTHACSHMYVAIIYSFCRST